MFSKDQTLNNLRSVEQEIKTLCLANHRAEDACRLLPVTKTVRTDILKHLLLNNYSLFGENKVQEMKQKAVELSSFHPRFHFIGHLQTNKAKDCLEHIELLHSLDRISLAQRLDSELQKRGHSLDVLVQVNTSGETSKFGTSPEDTLSLIKELSKFETLKIKGLMTLAIFSGEESKVRQCFKILKNLFTRIQSESIHGVEMKELSMGMSSDFKIAIEEGSTLVRVGQTIFGKRPTPDSLYWNENLKTK